MRQVNYAREKVLKRPTGAYWLVNYCICLKLVWFGTPLSQLYRCPFRLAQKAQSDDNYPLCCKRTKSDWTSLTSTLHRTVATSNVMTLTKKDRSTLLSPLIIRESMWPVEFRFDKFRFNPDGIAQTCKNCNNARDKKYCRNWVILFMVNDI